jgi:hypothetical protein
MSEGRLHLVPVDFAEANEFVRRYHRHHKPMPGCKFSLAAARGETIVGVAMVGRPVARRSDDGYTLEVNRLCTDGGRNVCSFLYGAAWRATRALGYRRLITFTLPSEGGASLRAAGWKLVGSTPGRSWSVPSRPRVDHHPLQERLRWEAV